MLKGKSANERLEAIRSTTATERKVRALERFKQEIDALDVTEDENAPLFAETDDLGDAMKLEKVVKNYGKVNSKTEFGKILNGLPADDSSVVYFEIEAKYRLQIRVLEDSYRWEKSR